MPKHLAVYTVLPDFEVAGAKGSDKIEWLEADDPDVDMEQAQKEELIGGVDPITEWTPYPAAYVKNGRRPIPASFYEFSSFLAATAAAKQKLSGISDFEWLALDPVEDTPAELAAKEGPSFYVMRFARQIVPHPQSEFTYFPGTKSINDVVSLVLNKADEANLYAFRLGGDPVTHYATQNLVDVCKREKLKGLEFTPIDCEFQ